MARTEITLDEFVEIEARKEIAQTADDIVTDHGQGASEIEAQDLTVDEAVELAAAKEVEIEDLQGAHAEMAETVVALENYKNRKMSPQMLAVSVESYLEGKGVGDLYKRSFSGVSMESASTSDVNIRIEKMQLELKLGMEGLNRSIGKAIGDWWAYSAKAGAALAADAAALREKINGLDLKKPSNDTFTFAEAGLIQLNGSADAKEVTTGFNNLIDVQETYKKNFKSVYTKLIDDVTNLYTRTAGVTDSMFAGGGALYLKSLILFMFGMGIVFLSAPIGIAVMAVSGTVALIGYSGLLLGGIYQFFPDAQRDPAKKKITEEFVKTLDAFYKALQSKCFGKPFSGNRTFSIVPSGNKLTFSIYGVGGADVNKNTPIKTPTKNELITLLKAVEDSSKAFTHRGMAASDLDGMWKHVPWFSGDDQTAETRAVQIGSKWATNSFNTYYVKPITNLSKIHVSVARSIIAYCNKAASNY